MPMPYTHIRSIEFDDGSTFPVRSPVDFQHFMWVREEYHFEDIQKEDIVIDLGANCGGFCIPASKRSDHIYAIEPLFADTLRENIALNDAKVTVIEAAMGSGSPIDLEYSDRKKTVETLPFAEIVKMAGGCDFLKCDCEGAEHLLTAKDIRGIRRIEMEIHRSLYFPWNAALFDAIHKEFTCTYDRIDRIGSPKGILHASRRLKV
jgi:FkbM family methyltransferase